MFEATSITAAYNMTDNFVTAYPGCTVVSRAISGSGIGTSAYAPGALSIWRRKATVIADAPNLLALEPGQKPRMPVPVGEVSAIARLDLNNAPLPGVKCEYTMVVGLPFAGSATATGDASVGLLESYGTTKTV